MANIQIDLGEPPTVDRLVVGTDEEDPVRRGRERVREPKLRSIHVLDLVDEQLLAPVSPAHALAVALRAAERLLSAHGYGDPKRSAEILHVALEDAHGDAGDPSID